MIDHDVQFFADHRDRQTRIRLPGRVLARSPQRAVYYRDECEGEFWSLGDHEKDRRRIIIYRIPADNPAYDPKAPQLLKIPFLLYADETVEDRDDVLLPIVEQLMREARVKHVG
jgi:hypothetical protein